MSVRLHQLSKEIKMANKELIELLKSRGFEVKSASSTIDNISAEALREEFSAETPIPENSETKAEQKYKDSSPKMPEGIFVKSADDIERERKDKVIADGADNPNVISDVSKSSPAETKPSAPKPPTPPAPHKSPPTTKLDKDASVTDGLKEEQSDKQATGSEDKKKIHVKPPIVVRDFACELGLKPFKLISELMEVGIFASMNQTIDESVATQLAHKHGFKLEIHHRGEHKEGVGQINPK